MNVLPEIYYLIGEHCSGSHLLLALPSTILNCIIYSLRVVIGQSQLC